MAQQLGGWVYDPEEVARWVASPANKAPVFAASGYKLRGSGSGKMALLYQDVRRIRNSFKLRSQRIGNCVSKGWSSATSYVDTIQRDRFGLPQLAEIAATPYYGFSRVEVGGRKIRGEGSVGAWAAKAAVQYGCLRQQVYGRYDLTTDDDDVLSAQWGDRGVPDDIEPQARELLVSSTSLVTRWEEVVDAVYNRCPVVVCTRHGFGDRRDQDGFVRRQGIWGHCWWISAVDDNPKRPGALLTNSWGSSWASGPKRHDQPDGTVWIDAEEVDLCVREEPDSFAIAGLRGLEPDPWVMI